MKLYSISERRELLPALCSLAVSGRRISPIVSSQWQDSVLTATVVPAPAAVLAAVVPAALVPAARVAGATESVRGDLKVRVTESEDRTDATSSVTTDEIHVASAAQLDQRGIRVQGTTGFSAKHSSMTAPKPNGGVRGIPPRGRPV